MGWLIEAFKRLWLINPFRIALVAFMLGLVPFLAATQFSIIGDISYLMPVGRDAVCTAASAAGTECLEKQVGYVYAINWWPALMMLFPFTLFFSFVSVQSAQGVFERLAQGRMLASSDWRTPVTDVKPILDRLWRNFFFLGVPLLLIVVTVMVRDWWCVVHTPLSLGVALGNIHDSPARTALVPSSILAFLQTTGCSVSGQENDWSIAATFGAVDGLGTLAPRQTRPDLFFNYAFSAYNYLLISLWSGLLFAYFGFVLALTITLFELNAGRFGCQLVLNLGSSDTRKRFGFESMEPIFAPCVLATVIAFAMAFLMRIQNVYLRDESYGSVFSLIFTDMAQTLNKVPDPNFAGTTAWLMDVLRSFQKFFAFDQFSDPQSLLGTPAILIMLGIVAATLGYILRRAAEDSRDRVLAALAMPGEAGARAAAYFGLQAEEARARASSLETWPLSWPNLRSALRLLLVGVVCYVFYRVAFIWIGIVAAQAIHGRWFGGEKT